MNCYIHTDVEATAYCRQCGRPLCSACQRTAHGTVYCVEHAPVTEAVREPAQPVVAPGASASPGLAFVLGFIPGVGAIYNGQYAKGLIHVVVLGVLISILSSGTTDAWEPLFGLLTALWFFYMAFEAYHTATRRSRGLPVDEFSSLVPMRSPQAGSTAAAVTLIVLGALFLLMNAKPEWAHYIFRLWPVLLIAGGAYMLIARRRQSNPAGEPSREIGNE